MAKNSSSAAKSATLVLSLCLLCSCLEASREYLVGGTVDGWKIPTSEADSLNKWAQSSRFRVGDSLVWKYDGEKDSVLQVSKHAYFSCNTTEPIQEYKDGNTKVQLTRQAAYYFISGAKGPCEKGQKLIVIVLTPRKHIAPAPSPVEFDGPAVAPSPLRGGGVSLQSGGGGFVVMFGVLLGFALM